MLRGPEPAVRRAQGAAPDGSSRGASESADAERSWFTAFAAFSAADLRPGQGPPSTSLAAEAMEALAGVDVRGVYDITGFRAEADLLLWLIAPDAARLQAAVAGFRRSALGEHLGLWWSGIGVHREAEFNRDHVPAFVAGTEASDWVCVYPYVRNHDWYLLPPQTRRRLLVEHGRMGEGYSDVQTNTVSAFGLGDYEWLLAFEANDLVRITDLMRRLRGAEARLYTRHELPFLTGRRRPLEDIVADLARSGPRKQPRSWMGVATHSRDAVGPGL